MADSKITGKNEIHDWVEKVTRDGKTVSEAIKDDPDIIAVPLAWSPFYNKLTKYVDKKILFKVLSEIKEEQPDLFDPEQ